MDIAQQIATIKTFIGEDDLEAVLAALENLKPALDEEKQDQILLYLQRFNRLEERRLRDIAPSDELELERRQLMAHILDWLPHLNRQTPTPSKVVPPTSDPPPQPLSPKTYIWVALGSLVIGLAMLMVLIFYQDMLERASNLVTFAVLFILGLAAAAFLFGVMRSYARVSGTTLNMAIDLGGPAAIFFIVLFLGYPLVEGDNEPFSYTINITAHGQPAKIEGALTLMLKDDYKTEPIGINGITKFTSIAPEFRKDIVAINLDHLLWQIHPDDDTLKGLKGRNAALKIRPKPELATRKGRVKNATGKGIANATVKLPDLGLSTTSNASGDFTFDIPTKHQTEVLSITIEAEGYKPYDMDIEPNDRVIPHVLEQ